MREKGLAGGQPLSCSPRHPDGAPHSPERTIPRTPGRPGAARRRVHVEVRAARARGRSRAPWPTRRYASAVARSPRAMAMRARCTQVAPSRHRAPRSRPAGVELLRPRWSRRDRPRGSREAEVDHVGRVHPARRPTPRPAPRPEPPDLQQRARIPDPLVATLEPSWPALDNTRSRARRLAARRRVAVREQLGADGVGDEPRD